MPVSTWMAHCGAPARAAKGAQRESSSGEPMTGEQIAAMRAYLRQWIMAPCWVGPDVETLRNGIDGLTDEATVSRWLDLAAEANIDPL